MENSESFQTRSDAAQILMRLAIDIMLVSDNRPLDTRQAHALYRIQDMGTRLQWSLECPKLPHLI
jgi:hypothetical protein